MTVYSRRFLDYLGNYFAASNLSNSWRSDQRARRAAQHPTAPVCADGPATTSKFRFGAERPASGAAQTPNRVRIDAIRF